MRAEKKKRKPFKKTKKRMMHTVEHRLNDEFGIPLPRARRLAQRALMRMCGSKFCGGIIVSRDDVCIFEVMRLAIKIREEEIEAIKRHKIKYAHLIAKG